MRFNITGQTRSRLVAISLLVAGVVLLLIFPGLAWLSPALAPVSQLFYRAGSEVNFDQNELNIDNLKLANELLEQEVNQLKIEKAVLKTQVEENELLRQQLNFRSNYTYNYVSASLLSRGLDAAFDQVVIDRGGHDGIQEGQAVIFGDGLLLGKIYQVDNNLSHVRLISDPLSKVAVAIQNGAQTVGILEGAFSLATRIELIPEDVLIEPGQIVVTSGFDPLIPAGLIVGEIVRVEKKTNAFFQTAYVEPLVPLSEPSIVSIITGQ